MDANQKRSDEDADRELLSDLTSAVTRYADARVAEAAAIASRERAESKLADVQVRLSYRMDRLRATDHK
jgi:hypothetical protein